ncbi:MAG: aminotransferase class V-fold PLP-dependent enzyme [Acidimicrobiia bacterium]|nr:aminotransferase class V-fold PLP-dependent enzyme [Acidimicrobiia bacterium]
MDLEKLLSGPLKRINPRLAGWAYSGLRRLPPVRRRLEAEFEDLVAGMKQAVKPYDDELKVHRRLPETGVERDDVLALMADLAAREEAPWREGFASGAVYHGDEDHVAFLSKVLEAHSQANPLHADLWPSATKFEAEVVAMTSAMLSAAETEDEIVGTVTSGGTESILLAVKTYRDRAAANGIKRPEIVIPVTAHVAFDKAAHYFGLKMVKIPVDETYRADVTAAAGAINRHTVVVVGSAPAFPHGTIDPIEELSALAAEKGVGFHTDACLGGFVLPWAERLGYPVPPFDFRLPGVTSMSADTHKYGYAAKGTSVVMYRGRDLRRHQYFTASDWPGGLYFSPTLAGSRPGALSAACWAALVSMGEQGYLEASAKILETAAVIRTGIEEMAGLKVLGDPLFVIAFGSDDLDIYQVMQRMSERGWSLTGLHRPPALHLAVTLRHTAAGVAERFLRDLKESVDEVIAHPGEAGGVAPLYGMAATVPARAVVGELLERYVDLLFEV